VGSKKCPCEASRIAAACQRETRGNCRQWERLYLRAYSACFSSRSCRSNRPVYLRHDVRARLVMYTCEASCKGCDRKVTNAAGEGSDTMTSLAGSSVAAAVDINIFIIVQRHASLFREQTRNTRIIISQSSIRYSQALPTPRPFSSGVAPSSSPKAADWSHLEHLGQSSRWRHAGPFLSSYYKVPLSRPYSSLHSSQVSAFDMTTANFKHIDPASYSGKPWSKVDGPG
jgi:hypothetical protein